MENMARATAQASREAYEGIILEVARILNSFPFLLF
jgi:hypothetical protein